MSRCPFGWAITYAGIIVVLCACSRMEAAAPTPEEVLKTHGLRLAGSLYVLELETDVQKKATEIRQLARKLKLAKTRQRATGSLEDYQQSIKGLGDQIKGYQSEIQAANQRMNQFPRYRRGAFADTYSAQAYSEIFAYRNQLQMELSQASASLSQLKSQPFDAQSKQKIDTLVRDDQESYDQAVVDLRKLVDAASEKYAELKEDRTIKKALGALATTAKVKPKLGPSPHFAATLKLMEKLDKEKASSEAESALDTSPGATHRSSRARHGRATDTAKSAGSGKSD